MAKAVAQRNGGRVMALTRNMLKGMGLTEEQVGAIIDEHVASIDGLKERRDKYKAEAEKLPEVQKELEELRESIDSVDQNEWQDKYKKEHDDFEKFKSQVNEENRVRECKDLYRSLLLETGVGDKHIDSILRVTDFTDIKAGKDGKLENMDNLTKDIRDLYGGFITSERREGAGVETPPAGSGQMTKEAFGQLPLAEQMKYANEHPNEINNLL